MAETLVKTELQAVQESALLEISPVTNEEIVAYLRPHKLAEVASVVELMH